MAEKLSGKLRDDALAPRPNFLATTRKAHYISALPIGYGGLVQTESRRITGEIPLALDLTGYRLSGS